MDDSSTPPPRKTAAKESTRMKSVAFRMGQETVQAVLPLVSDEIDQLHAQGRTYEEIACLIEGAIELKVTAEDVEQFHEGSQARHA